MKNQLKLAATAVALTLILLMMGCTAYLITPAQSPAAVQQPVLALNPTAGVPGAQVAITGTGLPTDTLIGLHLGVPNAGASPVAFVDMLTDENGTFAVALPLPSTWPNGDPITEPELVISAVEAAQKQTLATVSFQNTVSFHNEDAVDAGSEQVSEESKVYLPLDAEACEAGRAALAETLGVAIVMSEEEPFENLFDSGTGESCHLMASGTGEDFDSFVDVAQAVTAQLEADGWTADPLYVADGPTGTVLGFRRGEPPAEELAVLRVDWSPAAGIECPDDQPIGSCAENLEPAQQVYTITLDLVRTL